MSTSVENDIDHTSEPSSGLSRRRVLGTAAWVAPAIVVASAAPASAAFSTATVLSITSVGVATSNRTKTPGRVWFAFNGNTYTQFTESASGGGTIPGTINNPALLTTTVTGVKSTGGSGSEIVTLKLAITGQTTSGTTRGHGQYHTFDTTNWTLSGTPTIDAAKTVTFTFVSAAALSAGGTIPPLVFTTAVGSTTGGTSYAITAGTTATATASAPNATNGTMFGTLL